MRAKKRSGGRRSELFARSRFGQAGGRMRVCLLAVGALLAAILALAASGRAAAETELPDDLTNMSLDQLMELELVYGAARHEQRQAEAPATVTVFTAEEIRLYGWRTLADVLRAARSFAVRYDRNYAYLSARGLSRPGDYSGRVLLLMDGHRVNDNVYNQAVVGADAPIDVEFIERVEVIRGPGSALYGTSAVLGVINVVTRRGADWPGLRVEGEAAGLGAYKGTVGYGARFAQGEVALGGARYVSEGPDRLYFAEYDDPATNDGVAERVDGDDATRFWGKGTWRDFTLLGSWSRRDKEIPTGAYETVFNDDRSNTRDEFAFVDLAYGRQLGESGRLDARVSYDRYKYEGLYLYDFGTAEEPDLVLWVDGSEGRRWSAELQIDRRVGARHRLVGGGEFRDNFQQDQYGYDEYTTGLDSREDSRQWALFLQDEIALGKGVQLVGGARFDHYEQFGEIVAPRGALVWDAGRGAVVKALWGTAFRAPNCYEQYYESAEEAIIYQVNPDLDAERIRTAELVLEQGLGANLRGLASVYHYRMKDLIEMGPGASDSVLMFRNLGEVSAVGWELELQGRWPSGWRGRVSYAYQDAQDDLTAEPLSDAAKHTVKANLAAPLVAQRLFAALEVRHQSRRLTPAGGYAAAYWVTNATVSTADWPAGLELSASVYDVFDRRYEDPTSGEFRQSVLAQDGRTLRVRVARHF